MGAHADSGEIVAAIAVDIVRLERVRALTAPAFRAAFLQGVPLPHRTEFAAVKLKRVHLNDCVGAALDEEARGLAVEVSDPELVPARVVVVKGLIADGAGRPGGTGKFAAGGAVEGQAGILLAEKDVLSSDKCGIWEKME